MVDLTEREVLWMINEAKIGTRKHRPTIKTIRLSDDMWRVISYAVGVARGSSMTIADLLCVERDADLPWGAARGTDT